MIMTSATIKVSRASPQTSGTCHASASRGTMSHKLQCCTRRGCSDGHGPKYARILIRGHGHISVYCTPCCDAPDWTLEVTGEKKHHTLQACVMDRRTSSSDTVSFERQSIRNKTRHTLHGHNTETQSLIQRARRIFGDFDANVTCIDAKTRAKARIPGDVLRFAGHHLVLQRRHVLEVAGLVFLIRQSLNKYVALSLDMCSASTLSHVL